MRSNRSVNPGDGFHPIKPFWGAGIPFDAPLPQLHSTRYHRRTMKTALTISGSDSCGGAGLQCDLKTFSVLGVYGMTAITTVTAQNTLGVKESVDLEPRFI